MSLSFTPVIIIGAPRSGTNMLRNVLTALPGMATWPCDEINYIWRHGNIRYPSDEFTPEMARPEVCSYIRRQFEWVRRRYKAHAVVEKTCANSLRVGFVERVMPGARYIFIRRDGMDAIGSAIKRWRARMEIPYLVRKARFVPITDFPYYISRFIWNRIFRLFSQDKRLAFWGPGLDGMPGLLTKHTLEEVCALQWRRCVEKASAGLIKLPGNRWIEIGYEDLVSEPGNELRRVLDFLGHQATETAIADATVEVSDVYIGNGRKTLADSVSERLAPLIKDTQKRYGYF